MRSSPAEGVFCHVSDSDPAITGIIRYSEDLGCEASLYRFGEFFFIQPEEPIVLKLANGRYATLFNHFAKISGWGGSANNLVYYSDLISNRTFVGLQEFPPESLVHSIHFLLPGSEHILLSQELKKIARKSLEAWDRPENILEVETLNGRLTIGVTATDISIDHVGRIQAYYHITFDNPVNPDQIDLEVRNVSSFFSACLGRFLVARNIVIGIEPAESRDLDLTRFEIYGGRKKDDPAERSLAPHSSPFLFSTDDPAEKALFLLALRNWLKNSRKHSKQLTLMQSALLSAGTASDSKFLSACRWLDVTLSARPLSRQNTPEYHSLVGDVKRLLVEKGFEKITSRLMQAIGRTAQETHDERFARLVPAAFDGLGIPRGTDQLVKDMKLAFLLRGPLAHGTLEDISIDHLADATHSIEALAFVLTLDELTETRQRGRISEHPLLFSYVHSLGLGQR